MKRFSIILLAAVAILAAACHPNKPAKVSISLQADGKALAVSGITVKLGSFEAQTDAAGIATFEVMAGVYEASANYKKVADGQVYNYNGVSDVAVVEGVDEQTFELHMVSSKTSQLVIKEVYGGGCTSNDGAKTYATDKYIILYNNSPEEYDATDLCIGHINPANNGAANKYFVDGKMSYFDKGWIPDGWAFWGFNTTVKIAPYSQIIISITGAIDHTATYANSVDLRHADYVCYDPASGFNMASHYPAPDASIPESHYLKVYKFGMGTAWSTSNTSPSFFIFKMKAADATAFLANDANFDYTIGAKLPNAKIPFDIVVDAVETYNIPKLADCHNRYPASIDGGYVKVIEHQSHSIYRNVDKLATLALPENEGKIVYNYAGGTESIDNGSTDPSGIDAEASIAAGAHIIYQDTNNSSNDFHMRNLPSIKK